MHKNTVSIAIIALIVGVGIGYAGASMFARPAATLSQDTRGGFNGRVGGMMRGAGGLLSGTVAKKDTGSITLNTKDGNSRVIFITPDTSVSKSVSGTLDDVSVGATIIASGTTNSDGSVSASLIQLRPATPAPEPK